MSRIVLFLTITLIAIIFLLSESFGQPFEGVLSGKARIMPTTLATTLTNELGEDAPAAVVNNWREDMQVMYPDILGEPSDPRFLPLREGMLTTKQESVGLLIRSEPGGQPRAWCSGTLIDTTTFVTAAHCIEDRSREYWVYLQNVGIVKIQPGSLEAYCDNNSC
jgi:hypothetical protein